MRFVRFVGFSLVRAWHGFWRNAMMSLAATATVILMLVLLAGLFIAITALNSGLEFIEQKVSVTARLEDGLAREEVDALVADVRGLPGVSEVVYVSPAEAMRRLREAYRERGQTLDTGGAPITLYPSIEVSLGDPNRSAAVAGAIERRPEVEAITTKQSEYDRLLDIIGLVRTVGIVAIGLVGLTVLFMIVNTIRIAVHSRADEIEIMRLVGASDSFIRWPFIVEGVLCGVLGAIVTLGLVTVAWGPIQPLLIEFKVSAEMSARFLATLAGLLLAVGLTVGSIGSYISVRSYLSAAP